MPLLVDSTTMGDPARFLGGDAIVVVRRGGESPAAH